MNVTIAKNYDGNYTVTVEEAQRNDVLAIRAVTDRQQNLVEPAPTSFEGIPYAEPRNWSRDRQQAFITAARLHFASVNNKILTIKYLRTLSDPTLGLKDAKDLADYAIHGAEVSPLHWLKD